MIVRYINVHLIIIIIIIMHRKRDFYILVPNDLDLCPFHLRIISPFTNASSNNPTKYKLSMVF